MRAVAWLGLMVVVLGATCAAQSLPLRTDTAPGPDAPTLLILHGEAPARSRYDFGYSQRAPKRYRLVMRRDGGFTYEESGSTKWSLRGRVDATVQSRLLALTSGLIGTAESASSAPTSQPDAPDLTLFDEHGGAFVIRPSRARQPAKSDLTLLRDLVAKACDLNNLPSQGCTAGWIERHLRAPDSTPQAALGCPAWSEQPCGANDTLPLDPLLWRPLAILPSYDSAARSSPHLFDRRATAAAADIVRTVDLPAELDQRDGARISPLSAATALVCLDWARNNEAFASFRIRRVEDRLRDSLHRGVSGSRTDDVASNWERLIAALALRSLGGTPVARPSLEWRSNAESAPTADQLLARIGALVEQLAFDQQLSGGGDGLLIAERLPPTWAAIEAAPWPYVAAIGAIECATARDVPVPSTTYWWAAGVASEVSDHCVRDGCGTGSWAPRSGRLADRFTLTLAMSLLQQLRACSPDTWLTPAIRRAVSPR